MLEWLFGSKKQQPEKKKEKKPEAEDKWMYEFMVQFLSSPIWRVSILDFVDNKCIVFDNEEENKFEYTVIHNDFKELVGNLVDGMMDEIGMSQQKLAQIIQKGLESKQRKLFNQLLLADDFLRFKELMVKRNKALEQQAIKALHQSHNSNTNVSEVKQEKHSYETEIIRESQRMEKQRKQKIQEEEEQQLRKAIQMSKIQSKQSEAMKELQMKANDKSVDDAKKQIETKRQDIKREEKQDTNNKKPQSISINQNETKQKSSKLEQLKNPGSKLVSQLGDLPPIKGKVKQEVPEISQANMQPVEQTQEPQKQQTHEQQPSQPMEDRKQRLVAQRQKIRKQKEEERRKQLESESMEKQTSTVHQPVHTIVLQEDGFYDSQARKKQVSNQPLKEPAQQVSEGELKRRKQLMNKIKNKIIEDF